MTRAVAAGLPISLPLRIWFFCEVLFGLMSIATITATPADTARHFAWPIKPDATAALLGAFYLAAAVPFVLAVCARRWQNVRVFIIGTILFSSVELAATFLHWDRMSVGTMPFNVWFASYLLPPPLFIAFYCLHARRASAAPSPDDAPLAGWLRAGLCLLGLPLALLGIAVFLSPSLAFPLMAWNFTPLTARALSGWVLALGVLMLSAARENDRTRSLLVAPMFILLGPAIVLQLTRFPGQVDVAHPGAAAGLGVLVATFALGVALAARGNWRAVLR